MTVASKSLPGVMNSRQQLPTELRTDLSSVRSEGAGLPNRYLIHAQEKWGKTSFGAHYPKPIFVQSRGETGLDPLIDAGLLPPTPHFPESQSWEEYLSCLRVVRDVDHDHKSLVIDTLNGAERLCHEFICTRDFKGDWGDKGFGSYQKGIDVSLNEWILMLALLDEIRSKRRMTIVLLSHSKIAPFRNPLGADYDKFQPDVDKKTWGLTAKWSDVILFGRFEDAVVNVQENKKTQAIKGKGIGGSTRMMYTQNSAAWVAGNRLNLPPEIDMGDHPDQAWENFKEAIKIGRALAKETTVNAS